MFKRNFNSQGRGGFGNKSFGDRERPQLFRAVCSDCGTSCEVPFRPAPGKPVFCNNCFRKEGGAGGEKSEGGGGRFEKRSFGRTGFGGNRGDRPMFSSTCAECGERCEVPFRPTGEKPVYCSNCFGGKKGGDRSFSKPEGGKDQFHELNAKLDRIIRELEIIRGKKSFVVEKAPEAKKPESRHEMKKPEVKKTEVKTEVVKKEKAAKKAAEKKEAVKPEKSAKKAIKKKK